MNQRLKIACLSSVLALAMPVLADGQDDEIDDRSRDCITTSRIRNTKVVDDMNILFYMRGRTVYHNRMPRRCIGLKREGRFSYRSATGRLCQLDSINVLMNAGPGINPGASCRLGYFVEVSEEDVEAIIEGPKPPDGKPLPPAEPEEVGNEAEKIPEGS